MTQIKIEKKLGLLWKEVSIPFNGAREVLSSKMASAYAFYSVRVTVLAGTLTMKAPILAGPNSPAVKGYVKGQVFTAGAVFTARFCIGPVEVNKPGRHERSSIGVDTKELGVITTQSAEVIYVR